MDNNNSNINEFSAPSRKLTPENLRLLYSRLLNLMKLGSYEEVISGCKNVILKDSSFCRAYELLIQTSSELSEKSTLGNKLEQTIQFFQELKEDNPNNFYYLYGLGLAYKYGKNYPRAKENLEKSISLGADFWEVYEELIPYCEDKEELENEIVFFGEKIKQYPENFYLYQGLGYLHFWLDDYGPSLKYFQQALRLQKRRRNREAEAKCLYYLAYLYMYLNNYPQSYESIEHSIKISREIEDRYCEAQSLELLSFIHLDSGDYDRAFELCSSAFSISKEISNKKLKMQCLRTLGIIHMEKGNFSKAQEYIEKSSIFYKDLCERQRLGICLYWMTILHQEKGDFSKALECSKQGLQIAQQLGFKTGEAFHLAAMGDIYFSLGNYEKALKFNKQALVISETYIGKWSREECFNTIGYVYLEMKQNQKALEYFKQALNYIRRIGHKREEAGCLYNIGFAYFKMDNYPEALNYFLKSLQHADQSGKKAIKGINFNRLGDLYSQMHDCLKSEQYYSKALGIGKEIGHPNIIWEAYSGLGTIFACRKRYEEAVDYYKKAIEVIEGLRSQILVTEYSSGFFKSKISIYEQLVNLLYELHRLNPTGGYGQDCYYFAEKAEARAFLDDLQEARIDFGTFPSSPEQKDEIEGLSRKISHVLTDLNSSRLSRKERIALWNELEKTEDELQRLIEIVRREHSNYTNTVYLEPLRFEAVKNTLLDEKTGMIEYFVGEQNIFIFFCSQAGLSIHRLSSDVSRSTINLVKNYVKLLSSRHFTGSDCEIAGKKLYERLFQPTKNGFGEQIKELIIVPDRDLFYLPFEALICGNKGKRNNSVFYLMEKYRISYAPSASTLINIISRQKKNNNQKDLLAIGDPVYNKFFEEPLDSDDIEYEYYMEKRFNMDRLLYAWKEIKSISELFKRGSSLLIAKRNATEEIVKNMPLSNYKIIHFATHSLLDEKIANRSALVLNLDDNPEEDGFFQAREIYNAKLDAELVVLSACQTAKGKIEKGEGIQGLSRAFFYAGTKSVLASLWNVNDKSTSEFMKNFYNYLTKAKTKQEALCLTKIKMLESEYHQPYYWAAFILIGESDSRISLNRASFWDRLFSFL